MSRYYYTAVCPDGLARHDTSFDNIDEAKTWVASDDHVCNGKDADHEYLPHQYRVTLGSDYKSGTVEARLRGTGRRTRVDFYAEGWSFLRTDGGPEVNWSALGNIGTDDARDFAKLLVYASDLATDLGTGRCLTCMAFASTNRVSRDAHVNHINHLIKKTRRS